MFVMPDEKYQQVMQKGVENVSKLAEKENFSQILEGFQQFFLEKNDIKYRKQRGKGVDYNKSLKELLELSSSYKNDISKQPFIEKTSENTFILYNEYMVPGKKEMTVVSDKTIKELKDNNSNAIFLLTNEDLGITTVPTNKEELDALSGALEQRIQAIKDSGKKVVISAKGFGSRNQPTQEQGSTSEPKGVKVKPGIYVNQEALNKEEQLELFNMLKPYLEKQAAKTNKGVAASKMIGLGLRWDYKSNNPGKESKNIPDVINPGNKNKYGYYDTSINNQPLAPINFRFKELMQKATGVDMTNYDGAIINLYEANSFISAHNDVDESKSAINYPVIGVNIGGTGNLSIESRDGSPKQLDLKAGTGYVFGVDGVNREVWHRTLPKAQDSFLPELTTQLDGKTYNPGSYRVTITMRRVMPLQPGMPNKPVIKSTQLSTSVKTFDKKNIFTVNPIQSADKKAKIKASIATQYIGFGEGILGSSTETYRQQAGRFANTGNYSANDVIFVSIGGKRGTELQQKTQQDRTIKEAIKAVEAGATILTDNKAYTDASTYNTGEKRLYANMEAKGYNYFETTIDGELIGVWSKSTEPSTGVESKRTFKDEYLHQAYIKGGLEAVIEIIEKRKKRDLDDAKQLSKEVDMLEEFEELNFKANKTNSENDKLIELYTILKKSKQLDFEYSLNKIGLSTQQSTNVQNITDYNRAFNLTLNESLKENFDYYNPGSENATVSDIIIRMPLINDQEINDKKEEC
jgi:hypothetical protein